MIIKIFISEKKIKRPGDKTLKIFVMLTFLMGLKRSEPRSGLLRVNIILQKKDSPLFIFLAPTSSNLLLIRLIYSKQFIIHEELHNCNCKLVISRYCWLSSFNKQICVCWFESTVAAYGLCVTAAMYQHQLFYYIYITCCSTFYITHVLGSRWQTWQPAAM